MVDDHLLYTMNYFTSNAFYKITALKIIIILLLARSESWPVKRPPIIHRKNVIYYF